MPLPAISGWGLFLVLVRDFAVVGWGVLFGVCPWCVACAFARCAVGCGVLGPSCGALDGPVCVGVGCVCVVGGPRQSWLRALSAVPRYSLLGAAADGGGWSLTNPA